MFEYFTFFNLKYLLFELCIWIYNTDKRTDRCLVQRFHNMKNQFWAVGCGLGWTVKKRVWADYSVDSIKRTVLKILFTDSKQYF